MPTVPAIVVPGPEIVVPASAEVEEPEWRRRLEGLRWPRSEPYPWTQVEFGEATFAEQLVPKKIAKVVVESFPANWPREKLAERLKWMMTAGRLEGIFSDGIGWAEGVEWAIVAEVTLEDGRQGRVYTDGWHICYEDPAGYRWFNRFVDAKSAPGAR